MAPVIRTRELVLALIVLRLLLAAMAVVAIYTGVVLLTSPVVLPLTMALWLSALVMLLLAMAAKLPRRLVDDDRAVQQFVHRRAA